jgi:hypothetical protein
MAGLHSHIEPSAPDHRKRAEHESRSTSMANLRVDYFGLVAVVIHDSALGGAAEKVTLLFPDPASEGLDPHIPRIEIADANIVDWGRTTLTPEPNTNPLTFSLKGWDVAVRPDDSSANMVTFPGPRPDPGDPSGIRLWDTPHRFLDMARIVDGDDSLKDEFFADPGLGKVPKELMGRFAFDSGLFHTVSLKTGKFEKWRFKWQGSYVHYQEAAGHFTSMFFPEEFVTFAFTNLATARTASLVIKCPEGTAPNVKVRHTCLGTCKDHRGKHVPMYYKMMKNPLRKPDAEYQFTDASYCPPGRFMRSGGVDILNKFISA